MSYKGQAFNGNNRKKTRGRNVGTVEFTIEKKIEKDLGWIDHKSIRHLISTCPQTGKKVYAKQGKAIEGSFHTSLPKGAVIKKGRWGMKTWAEQEAVSGRTGLFNL